MMIGYTARETMVLEFASTVTALILAGKVGSSIASEIGTMRITGLLFVGIPLPGTGAWTGTLAASILDMDFKSSVLAVLLGVMLAAIIMGVGSLLVINGIHLFA